MAALAAEHVFYGENTSGVGGDMSSVAHQAAHAWSATRRWAAGAHRRSPATMTPTARRRRRARSSTTYFLDIGGKLLAVASLGDHYAERPARARQATRWPQRIVGHAYLVAYKFAEQNRAAISQVADDLVERRELNGDEITELMDSLHMKPAVVDYLEERTWPRL